MIVLTPRYRAFGANDHEAMLGGPLYKIEVHVG